MKITFLGTRGEIEEKERTHQYQTGLLVEGKEGRILLDCGEAAFLRQKPDAVFLTHAHSDHVKGLKQGTDLPIYLTAETEKGVSKFHLENRIRLEPGRQTTFKGLKITPLEVVHSVKAPAVCLRISEGDFKFLFAPDVLSIRDREKALEGIDLYIGDGSSLKRNLVRRTDDKVIGHASVKTQIAWLDKAEIKNAIFTHWGTEAVRLHGNTLKFRVHRLAGPSLKAEVASDGMKIDSEDYESLKAGGGGLDRFTGNILTKREKEFRMKNYEHLKKMKTPPELDEKMIPYLDRINAFPFLMTTQSCCGHGEDQGKGRHAHVDFRSAFTESNTIDYLLRPLAEKFISLNFELMTECDRLRYVVWLDNKTWEEQLKYFIQLLGEAKQKSRTRQMRGAELLEAVLPYRPKIEKKIDLARCRDDWRIFAGWYATLKEKGEFKYTKEEILNKFLVPCLRELIREGSTEFHPENWKKWPKEIYLEAFDKIVTKFRYLVAPHAELIYKGKKKATVHARNFIQGSFVSIVGPEYEFGYARFENGRKIDLATFAKLRDKHLVSEKERKQWWPGKKQLYFYKLRTWIPLEKPRHVRVPRGIQTYGTRADLNEAFVLEQSDRDVMLQRYDELKSKKLSKDEVITRIAKHFLPIGFDLEYWKGKVEAVLKREGKLEGSEKFAWKCDACGFVGEATDDEMGERMNTCPACGQVMKRMKEAKHRRDQCMKCAKPPEYEVLWAEGMGRAWFCEKHLKEWIWGKKGEAKKTGFAMDVNAVKKVDGGIVGKKWADNKNADLKKNLNRIMKEQEGQIKDFEYLLHHLEIGEDGKEKIHHCYLYDHNANLFEQAHLWIKGGQVYLDGKQIDSGVFHVIKGLEPTQEVVWSDAEAEAGSIKPKKMKTGMTLKQKSKEW